MSIPASTPKYKGKISSAYFVVSIILCVVLLLCRNSHSLYFYLLASVPANPTLPHENPLNAPHPEPDYYNVYRENIGLFVNACGGANFPMRTDQLSHLANNIHAFIQTSQNLQLVNPEQVQEVRNILQPLFNQPSCSFDYIRSVEAENIISYVEIFGQSTGTNKLIVTDVAYYGNYPYGQFPEIDTYLQARHKESESQNWRHIAVVLGSMRRFLFLKKHSLDDNYLQSLHAIDELALKNLPTSAFDGNCVPDRFVALYYDNLSAFKALEAPISREPLEIQVLIKAFELMTVLTSFNHKGIYNNRDCFEPKIAALLEEFSALANADVFNRLNEAQKWFITELEDYLGKYFGNYTFYQFYRRIKPLKENSM